MYTWPCTCVLTRLRAREPSPRYQLRVEGDKAAVQRQYASMHAAAMRDKEASMKASNVTFTAEMQRLSVKREEAAAREQ